MPTKKTTPVAENKLSEEELFNVMKYAQEIYNSYVGSNYIDGFGAYTPYITNQRLAEIGLTPKDMNSSEIADAIANPTSSGSQTSLIGYSEWLQFTEAISKRTLGYLGNLPSWDYTFTCINISESKEYDSKEYKEDLAEVKKFLVKFNPKQEFAMINRLSLAKESFFGMFRTDGDNYAFQELPYRYCMIVGRNVDYGFVFDFNLTWFLRQGLSINQYPSAMKKLWRRVFGDADVSDYNPSNPLKNRKGTFSTWAQTSPLLKDGGFTCFKFNSDLYANTPFLTALFNDALNKPLIRQLQNNQYIIASQKILLGLIPFLKEQKSGQLKDNIAVDATTLGNFLGMLKRGIHDSIKVGGLPFSDIKDIKFDLPEHNMTDDYSKTLAANTGVTSRMVYSTDRMSSTEVQYSANIDEMIATQVYPQYALWLSTIVNTYTKKYKFKFTFEGTKYDKDKEKRLDKALKLADKGMTNFQSIAAACGKNIFEFEEQLMASAKSPIWQFLKLLPNANTSKSSADNMENNGRPKKEIVGDDADRNLEREAV